VTSPKAPASLVPKLSPSSRLFLIHGTDEARIAQARRELLGKLLAPEERDQNFTELAPSGNRPLSLAQVANSIIDELSTPTFFPDQKRVVLVSQPQEIFGASGRSKSSTTKAKKADAKSVKPAAPAGATGEERLVAWLDREFPALRSILIFEALEDEDKRRKVDSKSPLAAYLTQRAVVLRFYDPPVRQAFEEALLRGDAVQAIATFREWLGPDTRFAILSCIVDTVRCLIQAAMVVQYRRGAAASRLGGRTPESFLPSGWRNLAGKYPNVRSRYEAAAERFPLARLIESAEELADLNDAFFPPRNDTFVRDLPTAVESFILRLCAK
jgi:hypothetical protein